MLSDLDQHGGLLMGVAKIVSTERVQQIAMQKSASVKNKKSAPIVMKGPKGQAVQVNIGSGLEKTAQVNDVYK